MLFAQVGMAAEFVSSCRVGPASYLLTGIGEVYEAAPNASLRKAFMLSANKLPVRWHQTPTSIAAWHSALYVANSTNALMRFDAHGAYLGSVALPVRTQHVVASDDALWIVNPLAPTRDTQLYRSTDGASFAPVPADGVKGVSILSNLLILGGGGGEVYVANTIGPPVVRRVSPLTRKQTFALAYARTKFRSTMLLTEGVVEDVSIYSLPVRSLYVPGDGTLLALRNREDVLSPTGRVEQWLGRRIDKYDSRGRHVATALLPRSAHFIVYAAGTSVTAVSRSGDVVTGTWGAPVPGAIIGQ